MSKHLWGNLWSACAANSIPLSPTCPPI
jgi:hypothetical protein